MTSEEPEWLKRPKTFRICPKCKKNELDTRIPRGSLVKTLLFWKPYKRYRCSNCHAEVYILEKD